MSQINYRTINVDQLDPESSANFPMETLLPATLPQPETSSDAANVASQVRQLLRGGDAEAALRHVLDTAPLGGDDRAKEVHMATVIEVLQGIRQGEMSRVLEGVCGAEGGAERADCLMKYMYVAFGNKHIEQDWSIRALANTFLPVIRECPPPLLAAELSHRASRSRRRARVSRRFRVGTWVRLVVVSK